MKSVLGLGSLWWFCEDLHSQSDPFSCLPRCPPPCSQGFVGRGMGRGRELMPLDGGEVEGPEVGEGIGGNCPNMSPSLKEIPPNCEKASKVVGG